MSIELDTSRMTTAFQSVAQDTSTNMVASKATAALLGGASVTVSDGGMTDLEALVAKLKNDSERAKISLMMTSLASIGQSLTESQRRTLEQGLALQEQLTELEKSLGNYTSSKTQLEADSAVLQAKIDSLQKQIDQAIADGKEHNKLVAEQKQAKKELEAKKQVIADTQGKIDETKNAISSVKGQISAIVKSIGENTIKTIANEIAALAEPEKAERQADIDKEAAKLEANNPFAVIRESLNRIEQDLTETILENRIETV